MEDDQTLEAVEVRPEIRGPNFIDLGGHLSALAVPITNKMSLAFGGFQGRHDLECWKLPEVRRRQDAARQGMGENAAREITIQHLAFPGREHIADATHPLSVPENLAGKAQLIRVKA